MGTVSATRKSPRNPTESQKRDSRDPKITKKALKTSLGIFNNFPSLTPPGVNDFPSLAPPGVTISPPLLTHDFPSPRYVRGQRFPLPRYQRGSTFPLPRNQRGSKFPLPQSLTGLLFPPANIDGTIPHLLLVMEGGWKIQYPRGYGRG